jgi:uncharacterized protein (DUF1810 family)
MDDPFALRRFVQAQAGVYETACAELRQGCKRSHWMWFIFPQIQGLGQSATSRRYAISCLEEAQAYLAHELLGPRLRECTGIVLAIKDRSANQIFGAPDDRKFRSSMTLFAKAAPGDTLFGTALDKLFAGTMDEQTLQRL